MARATLRERDLSTRTGEGESDGRWTPAVEETTIPARWILWPSRPSDRRHTADRRVGVLPGVRLRLLRELRAAHLVRRRHVADPARAGAAAAAIFGTIDLLNLPKGTTASNTGRIHAALNSTALVIFLCGFLWRFRTQDSWEAAPVGPLVLSVIGIAVGASGFLGGKLAYHYGIRVADESVQAEGFRTPTTTR